MNRSPEAIATVPAAAAPSLERSPLARSHVQEPVAPLVTVLTAGYDKPYALGLASALTASLELSILAASKSRSRLSAAN